MPQVREQVKGSVKETPPARVQESVAQARDQIRQQKLETQQTKDEAKKLESDLLEAQLIDRQKSEAETQAAETKKKIEDVTD